MNRSHRSLRQRLSRTAQATAGVCVTLLLLLSWLAVDPAAHAWLHAHESHGSHADDLRCDGHASHGHGSTQSDTGNHEDDDDSMCVVTAFAGGATDVCGSPLSIQFVPLIATDESSRDLERIAVVQTALHPPSCGPPGAV